MRLVTYRSDKRLRAGVLLRDYVVDLQEAAAWCKEDVSLPNQIIDLLETGTSGMQSVNKVLTVIEKDLSNAVGAKIARPLSDVSLFAPVPRPSKILCIGLNYRAHAEEANLPIPKYPMLFTKYANTIIGPNDNIVIPRVSEQIDFEAELGVVIGRRGRYISEGDAMDYVAGYVCFNDVSARDYQGHTSQFTMGKSFDTHGPMGPYLVTRDEILDPHSLKIELKIGDEILQCSNTNELIFRIPKLISYLSEAMTLEPGDVIATGTPAGMGFGRNPKRFLRPGEVVEVSIEGIGQLRNPVISEK